MRTLLLATLILLARPVHGAEGEAPTLEELTVETLAACDMDAPTGEVGRRLADLGPEAVPHLVALLGRELAPPAGRAPVKTDARIEALLIAAQLLGREPFVTYLGGPEAGEEGLSTRLGGLKVLEHEGRARDLELMVALAERPAATELGEALEATVKALLLREPRAYDRLGQATAGAGERPLIGVARAVGEAKRPEGLPWLAATLERTPSQAALLLSQIDRLAARDLPPFDEDLRRPARELLWSEDPMIVRLAARAAAGLADPDACERLIDLLEDEAGPVRTSAHEALRTITGLGFAPDVRRWRSWHAKEVRFQAEEAAERIHALDHPLPSQVMTAMGALAAHRLDRETTALAIARVLDNDNPELRRVACISLARLGARAVVPALLERLNDRDDAVVEEAWRALRAITGLDLPVDWKAWDEALAPASGDERA